MFPFITLFGRTIALYQIMTLAGILAAGFYAAAACKKNGKDENEVIVFLLLSSTGVLIGSRLLYALVNYRETFHTVKNLTTVYAQFGFLRMVNLLLGGSVFYGGLLGGIVAAIFVCKKPERAYLLDMASPAIPLFHFFGRIGCFLSGCCFGIESRAGFTFHHAIVEAANGTRRFPVQLLEAAINAALFLVLDTLQRKNMVKHNLLYIYLLCYSAARFFIEFLRGDEYRGFLLGLSTSQIISVLIFCFAARKVYSTVRQLL